MLLIVNNTILGLPVPQFSGLRYGDISSVARLTTKSSKWKDRQAEDARVFQPTP